MKAKISFAALWCLALVFPPMANGQVNTTTKLFEWERGIAVESRDQKGMAPKQKSASKPPKKKAFKWVKGRTAYAYYTSKIGIHQEMEYKGNSLQVEYAGEEPK